jgi:hypothetical protein
MSVPDATIMSRGDFLEEVDNKSNENVIDELLSPDFVDRSLMPGQDPTRADFKQSGAEFRDAFSIPGFTIAEQTAEDDKVVTKCTERSVMRGGVALVGEDSSLSRREKVG